MNRKQIKNLSEADTRAKLIDPAIHKRGWSEDLICREETVGAIDIVAGKPRQLSKGRIDYTLRIKFRPNTQPVAIALIEAKKSSLPPGHGLTQAKSYMSCKRLNVPFVFSSNGFMFVEFDRFTGITAKPKPMSRFPTPSELRERYEKNMGFNLESPVASPMLQPYKGGESSRRYYQDAAIRAVLEKIAIADVKSQPKRALLSLATGAGKTFIAVNLLKRIADAGQLRRALFVCDREELRNQGLKAFQNIFGSDAAEVFRTSDGKNNAKNARIHVATYQTLGIDNENGDASFLTEHYPKDFFTHIVIDECHRSAWGKWSLVLTRNSKAVHVGLTATPREFKTENTPESKEDAQITANNIQYFGEPVYEYNMAQAIEDGYLAACEIQKSRVNIDDTGITVDEVAARNPVDAVTGETVVRERLKEIYGKREYEDKILLPDRVLAMCQDLFKYLTDTGVPEQKTVIFCKRDRHADDVAFTMGNLYAEWCGKNKKEQLSYYAFKCTAASSGNDQLPDFRASTRSHFIATTVDLLTTGVDVPCIRNIVFFKYVNSPISFYQMIGRGTRIHHETDKLMFRVYDYTNATRLFGEEFISRPKEKETGEDTGTELPPEPTIIVEGFEIYISDEGRYIVADIDGKAMPVKVEEYKSRLAKKLLEEVGSLNDFRKKWVDPGSRQEIINSLAGSGYSPKVVQIADDKEDYDLYDVLAELGWGVSPCTRKDRSLAFIYKHEKWINALPEATGAIIRVIANQFERAGTEGLENPKIFQTPEIISAGGLAALKMAGKPADLIRETKERIFSA